MDVFFLPHRLNRYCNGEDVIIFVKEDIPSNLLIKHDFPSDVEGLFVELNFRKSKWLLFGTYHLPAQNDQYFLIVLIKFLILTVTMMFYLHDILMQKTMNLA